MKNSMALVSVIIPVYNVEDYLSVCLDSVLKQTHENLQIILIDDGSKDSSLEVCRQYASVDSRIEVFGQKNEGVSSARNNGINHVRGEWVVFVDSDDYIFPRYVQNLLDAVLYRSCDMAISGIRYWNEKNNEMIDKTFENIEYYDNDLVKALNKEKIHYSGGPVSKIYNTKIIKERHILFNTQMHYAEDCNFMLSYIYYAHSIAFINCVDYVYRLHSGSLSSRNLQYSAECICKDEMYKRYEEMMIRFPNSDLSDLKASILQYYGRVSRAILKSADNFFQKRQKLVSLSHEVINRYSKTEFCNYKAYCLYEEIILKLLSRATPVSMLLFDYAYFLFSKIRFVRQ